MKKIWTIGLWIVLITMFVIADSPSIPSILSPDNNANIFEIPTTLTCSGFTDPEADPTFVEFYKNYTFGGTPVENYTTNDGWSTSSGTAYSYTRIDTKANCIPCYIENVSIGTGDNSNELEIYLSDGSTKLAEYAIVNNIAVIQDNLSPSNTYYFAFHEIASGNVAKVYKDIAGGTIDGDFTQKICGQNNENPPFDCVALPNRIQSIYQMYMDINGTINEGVSLIDNTTGTSGNYTSLIGGTVNTWTCRACDDTGECSNFTDTRNINSMNFTACDSGNVALNLTFVNESNTAENLSSKISSMLLTFNSDDSTPYIFSNNSNVEKQFYQYCFDPNSPLSETGSINFLNDLFPQRQFYLDETLVGNTTFSQTLYLLPLTDGIYSTIQVINTADESLPNVLVIVEKQFGGTFIEILGGLTDDSGSITFWIDPNNLHRFTFTKSGYNQFQTSFTPTQSVFTATMSGISTVNQSTPSLGITYEVTPQLLILNNNTDYNFGFNISSDTTLANLTGYGFDIVNSTGNVLGSASGTTGAGSYVNQTIDTDNHTSLTMQYYWTVDGNTQNGSQTWNVISSYEGSFSIKNFFDDLKTFAEDSAFGGSGQFTLAMIALVIIITFTGFVSLRVGIQSPLAILFMITGLVLFLDIAGVIPNIGNQTELLGVGFISVITILLFGGYVIFEHIK